MDVLASVFPHVPQEVLSAVLRMCSSNIQAASSWLLENDWQELEANFGNGGNPSPSALNRSSETSVLNHPTENNATSNGPNVLGMGDDNEGQDDDDIDDEDEDGNDPGDDDDEDDDDEDIEYDELDEDDEGLDDDDDDEDDDDDDTRTSLAYSLPHRNEPPSKRRKIEITPFEKVDSKEDRFWVRFDRDLVHKSMIELLNISLSKLSHNCTILSNTTTNSTSKVLAEVYTNSIVRKKDENIIKRNTPSPTPLIPSSNLTRFNESNTEENSNLGFWCYYFAITDLDMIWRTVLNAHLFNKRFGATIEFHSVTAGDVGAHTYDDSTYYRAQTSARSSSSRSTDSRVTEAFQFCLILPCSNDEKEIYRVGKYMHVILNLKTAIYYRKFPTVSNSDQSSDLSVSNGTLLNGEHGAKKTAGLFDEVHRMPETYHEQNSDYRLFKTENEPPQSSANSPKKASVLSYRPEKSVKYTLQKISSDGWVACTIED